jgi:hypothetical protein
VREAAAINQAPLLAFTSASDADLLRSPFGAGSRFAAYSHRSRTSTETDGNAPLGLSEHSYDAIGDGNDYLSGSASRSGHHLPRDRARASARMRGAGSTRGTPPLRRRLRRRRQTANHDRSCNVNAIGGGCRLKIVRFAMSYLETMPPSVCTLTTVGGNTIWSSCADALSPRGSDRRSLQAMKEAPSPLPGGVLLLSCAPTHP